MKGSGTVEDPWQVVTLDDFIQACEAGGKIIFCHDIDLGDKSISSVVKSDVDINLNGCTITINKHSDYINYRKILISAANNIVISQGVIAVTLTGRIQLQNERSAATIRCVNLLLKFQNIIVNFSTFYRCFESKNDLLIWLSSGSEATSVTGAGYVLKVKPKYVSHGEYISITDELNWTSYPALDKSTWEMTPEGPMPKSSGITYIEGTTLVNGIPAAGRLLEVQSLHPTHPKVLRTARSEEGGKFKIGLSGYSYPVMVFAYDDVQDVIEPGTDYQLDYRLLPPVSNGSYLRCITAGQIPAVLPDIPASGEVTIGTAHFEVKPLAPPSIHGPLTPAVETV